MFIKSNIFRYSIVGLLASIVLISNTVYAERELIPGYVTDSEGSILRSSYGECVRSSYWKPKNAVIVGCDNVVLKAPIEITKGDSTGVLSTFIIPAASMFTSDSAEITTIGKQNFQEYRAKIKPEITKAYVAIIVGHSDNHGKEKYNLDLSKNRAAAVRDYLIAGGIPALKLRIVGLGAKEPIATNETESGRALNRRVEVIIFAEARALDVMRFPSVALFPRKSSELTLRGKQLLDKNKIAAKKQLARAVYIEIIGHTDDVGDKKKNQRLSKQRAETIRTNLILAGVDPSKIMTVGAGESQPIASNQTEEGRAQNRRVEVIVLGRLKH